MQSGNGMTMQEAEQEIKYYQKIFQVARLLKGEDVEQTFYQQGKGTCENVQDGCPCYSFWKKNGKCENCSSYKALREKKQMIKLEFLESEVYQVISRYMEIDGQPYVMELINHLEDDTLIDISCREKLINKLTGYNEKLYKDVLTGVYNRLYFEEEIKMWTGNAGIVVIDVDDFKLCNDTYGHLTGDMALAAVAGVIWRCIRREDTLVRYGGDEFLLIMPNVSSSIFAEKLRTIQERIHEADFPEFPGLKISASIGGAMLYNGSIEEVVSRADKLMYYAKSYKNTVAMDEEVEYEKTLLDAPTAKPRVLIVDDSELNRDLLKEMLRDRYEVLEAADGEKGLALLYELGTKISLVLLDVVMPKLGGFDVLAVMQKERWLDDIPVMMISAEDSPAFIQRAYDMGASDYITRPFNMNVVRQRSDNITKLYAKQRRLLSLVSSQIQEKERNNHIIISILSEVVGLKNGESRKHILSVSRITELLLSRVMQRTNRYHLTWQDEALITNAAALHDIGKIGIDEKILNKPGKLTREEFEIMKTHTLIGAKMVENLEAFREEPFVKVTYAICRWHHERWDGRGYPDGLKGDAIPISAQIVSIADVYDALTSKRVYKDAFAHEKAIWMILNGECGLFNPLLLDCLLDIKDSLKEELEKSNTDLAIHRKIPDGIIRDL